MNLIVNSPMKDLHKFLYMAFLSLTYTEQVLFVAWEMSSSFKSTNEFLKRKGMKELSELEYANHFDYLDRTFAVQ